jgi:hypothetical protein
VKGKEEELALKIPSMENLESNKVSYEAVVDDIL